MRVVIRPPEQHAAVGDEKGCAGGGGERAGKMDKAVSKKLMLIAQFFGLQVYRSSRGCD
jgi:hypothetical protein